MFFLADFYTASAKLQQIGGSSKAAKGLLWSCAWEVLLGLRLTFHITSRPAKGQPS
jgi:hypothetical protein